MSDGDELRIELMRQRNEASRRVQRGWIMLFLVPLIAAVGFVGGLAVPGIGGFMLILSATAYTIVGSLGGLAKLLGGAVDHRRASKELKAIEETRQLPAARVVRGG